MKKVISLFLAVFFISNNAFAYTLSGQAGIVLNSGEVRYIAKRHLFLSQEGFNNTYFEIYYSQPYSDFNKWLEYNNASEELIEMANTDSTLQKYLRNGFLGFVANDFSRSQRKQMELIPEFNELMNE